MTPTSISGCTSVIDPSRSASAWQTIARQEMPVAASHCGRCARYLSTADARCTSSGTVPATRCCSAFATAKPEAESRPTASGTSRATSEVSSLEKLVGLHRGTVLRSVVPATLGTGGVRRLG